MIDKKNIKHICFDLDGTLVSSHKTIYKATLKALQELNLANELDEKIFTEKIGHHFEDIFIDMNIEVNDFEKFITVYKNCYFDFIDESTVFKGTEDILKFLKANNFIISLLTTKSQAQAEKIINYFKLDIYFDFIMGRRPGISFKPDAEPLLFICNNLSVLPEQTIFVGDTELDVFCGKNANAFTAAVTYGYRSKDFLMNISPDLLIDRPSDLIDFFNNN